jgi:hypothetical protein
MAVDSPQFSEISNSVGSITAGNCTFSGVSIPRSAHSRRKRSTGATPHEEEPMETGSCDGNATESVNLPD